MASDAEIMSPERLAGFYVTGGTLPAGSSSYVTRQADADLYAHLKNGEFCYVLNTRQMGKSSLCARTIARLHREGVQTVFLDLTRFGGQNVTAEQWYLGLLSETGRSLGLRKEFIAYAREHAVFSPLERFFGALEQIGLSAINQPMVIFIDEIDAVRSLPFATDEFFLAIREAYNRRALDSNFERLTFCLLGTAAPADLIQYSHLSPFNIGRRILVTDFTPAEAAPLAQGLGANGEAILERILYWTGGHPNLTQRLCQSIAASTPNTQYLTPPAVDALCETMFLTRAARDADDNLSFVRKYLLEQKDYKRADVLDLYLQIRSGKRIPDQETNPICSVLKLSGVAKPDAQGNLIVRNRIYKRVFDRAWIVESMPGQELRRQRRAAANARWQVSLAICAALMIMTLLYQVSQLEQVIEQKITSPRKPSPNPRPIPPAETPKPTIASDNSKDIRIWSDFWHVAVFPEPLFREEIKVPTSLLAAPVKAVITVRVTVEGDGSHSEEIVKGSVSTLDAAVLTGMKKWRWKPAEQFGKPVKGTRTVRLPIEIQ